MLRQPKAQAFRPAWARGYSLIEVLVTFVILAIGLLGLAQLNTQMHQSEMESYQQAQAVLLVQDMTSRIQVAGSLNAGTYVTGTSSPLGTGESPVQPATCTGTGATYDWCVWSNALKGAAEVSAGSKVGAMIGARGCIEQIQAPNTTAGSCAPGIYRVTVVWQGLAPTAAPPTALVCGANLYGSGNNADAYRRAVSTKVNVATQGCQS